MELASVNTPAAAFVAGLVTSLHCAGMCGPLACWLMPVRKEDDAATLSAAYQLSRLFGYTVLGAVSGALGGVPGLFLDGSLARVFPWAMVVFFLVVALGWDKRLPKPVALARLSLKVQQMLKGRSRLTGALVLGGATPLLPCGPLYFLIALAAFTGSPLRGAEFMLAFGLGTLPLLWFVQANFGWLQVRLSPRGLARLQAGLALATALVLVWRMRADFGLAGPSAGSWGCF
ncbi:MAG: sulfite exporter TauE/SafE family protein [Opitutaceae bacterium]|nr:sulfite exporter TauE/SafE family protein [Opitutaceae bacterium]